jgi:hypothetical protein
MEKQRVLYKGKEYLLIHSYESGFCEIRELRWYKVELVHNSELEILNRNEYNAGA